mmetsp:Transcript_52643/g.93951  ORF Transcript_52643/g.93951 Transcript_52643/m.93951 type:complete len:231 (+) Transcript_52643:211-903(+)
MRRSRRSAVPPTTRSRAMASASRTWAPTLMSKRYCTSDRSTCQRTSAPGREACRRALNWSALWTGRWSQVRMTSPTWIRSVSAALPWGMPLARRSTTFTACWGWALGVSFGMYDTWEISMPRRGFSLLSLSWAMAMSLSSRTGFSLEGSSTSRSSSSSKSSTRLATTWGARCFVGRGPSVAAMPHRTASSSSTTIALTSDTSSGTVPPAATRRRANASASEICAPILTSA